MTEALKDISDESLKYAIDANQIAAYFLFGSGLGTEGEQREDITWFITGVPHMVFNGVLHARFDNESANVKIPEIIEKFKSRKLPMMWWTGPMSSPDDLPTLLKRHGLKPGGYQPGMAIKLDTLEPVSTTDFIVVQAETKDHLEEWSIPVQSGFDLPEVARQALVNHFYGLFESNDDRFFHFIAQKNGQTIASSSLFLGAGVAGLYYVATLPEFKRQGIGKTMTLIPYQLAREKGYHIGVLQSTEAGLGLYKKLGFKKYCELGRFVLL